MDCQKIPLLKITGDMVEFVRRIVADVANDPRADQYEFDFEAAKESIEATFDQKLLGRALYNLLINAVYHNSPGTNISTAICANERIQIVIKDNGVGMDEEIQCNLFNKYYRGGTTKEHSEGTIISIILPLKP